MVQYPFSKCICSRSRAPPTKPQEPHSQGAQDRALRHACFPIPRYRNYRPMIGRPAHRPRTAALVDIDRLGNILRAVAQTPSSEAVPHADSPTDPVVAYPPPAPHATTLGYALDANSLFQNGPLALNFVSAALYVVC